MIIISGGKGTGKTKTLIEKVKAEDGILACEDVALMRARAYAYGITGLDIISYEDLANNTELGDRPVFVHDINRFIADKFKKVKGYTLCNE